MSPRKNYPKNRRPKSGDDGEIHIASNQSFEEDENGLWIVRKLTGSAANNPDRCPGCDQVIPMATPHTVAWLDGNEDNRRHWHNACWTKRNNRGPRTERTRNAPRY
jgi:hypothetical protein